MPLGICFAWIEWSEIKQDPEERPQHFETWKRVASDDAKEFHDRLEKDLLQTSRYNAAANSKFASTYQIAPSVMSGVYSRSTCIFGSKKNSSVIR